VGRQLGGRGAEEEWGVSDNGAVPPGWDAVSAKLVENAAEQGVIAEMRARQGQGLTTRAVGKRLNRMGFLAKRGGKSLGSAVASVLRRNFR
jgi:hypothetical protein